MQNTLPSVVRAFVFDPEGRILLVQHTAGGPHVLPGGHVETAEPLHIAMQRELQEEFAISAEYIDTGDTPPLRHRGKDLVLHPLPITSYTLEYKNSAGVDKSRVEYIYLMTTADTIDPAQVQKSEIHAYAWHTPEAILQMRSNIECFDFVQEILEYILDDGEDEE